MTKLFSAAAATLAILCATSAQAETQRLVMVSTTLAYDTQDLTGAAGATKLLGRIELAARKLCAVNSPAASPTSRHVVACRHAAVARAVDNLAAPLVTAAYERSNGRPSMAVATR